MDPRARDPPGSALLAGGPVSSPSNGERSLLLVAGGCQAKRLADALEPAHLSAAEVTGEAGDETISATVAHRDGWSGASDMKLAAELGERARAGGNAYSRWGLGDRYAHGVYKPRDPAKAKTMLQLACPAISLACEALRVPTG